MPALVEQGQELAPVEQGQELTTAVVEHQTGKADALLISKSEEDRETWEKTSGMRDAVDKMRADA